MLDSLPTTSLTIVNQTLTLTIQQDVAWVLTTLCLMGVVSVVHVLLDWKDSLMTTVKGWVRRG
jgi:hypothetical protein